MWKQHLDMWKLMFTAADLKRNKGRAIRIVLLFVGALLVFGRLGWLLAQDKKKIPHDTTNIAKNSNVTVDKIQSNDLQVTSRKNKYAYITLIHGIEDELFNYRGYLYSALVAVKSLRSAGSTADFIVMYGYSTGTDSNSVAIKKDLLLLSSNGIILYELPRLVTDKKVSFLEMALLKISPLSFTQYDRVQYLDGDVFPHKSMDCYFSLNINTFNTGNASPLNSGWFLVIPNATDFATLRERAIRRINSKWNETIGWGRVLPSGITFRGGKKEVKRWDFNGASLDQGLFLDYFILQGTGGQLIDISFTHVSSPLMSDKIIKVPNKESLQCCEGVASVQKFHHFTGHSKPWLKPPQEGGAVSPAVRQWMKLLDDLNLPLNSSSLQNLNLKPPLGYFYPNKR